MTTRSLLCLVCLPLLAATAVSLAQEPATYARFVPERSDDFAWENDIVAFRAYGPALRKAEEDSGIDCWLKRVEYPIIDRWYAAHQRGQSYHQDHGEGFDPYHVGSSRGCGGTALWVGDRMIASNTFVSWRIVESSAPRTVFELDYIFPAQPGEAPIHETKKITILMGEPFFEVNARFTREGKPVADLPVAIGVTTHDGKAQAATNEQNRWISCWEKIEGSGLGTGVVLAKGLPIQTRLIEPHGKDTGHVLILTRTNGEGMITYHAGYGWEKAGLVKTEQEWAALLDAKADK